VALFRQKPRTRAELVAGADRARSRGRVRAAIAGYREALAADPSDPSVNVKLAPLLARIGDADGGARCFRAAAERHLTAGFVDRAAAVCLSATTVFPLDAGFRLEVARLNLQRGRKADAVAALVEGGRALSRARRRDAATSLLRRALEISPDHLEALLAVAPLLASEGRRAEARALLASAEERAAGPDLRRVRWALFRLSPSVGTLARAVVASFGRDRRRRSPAKQPTVRPAPVRRGR
jgi:Tfp pilus assembly protein PilF